MPDKYGIIGYPLKHSLSPFMHNRYAYYLGENESYEAFEVLPSELKNELSRLYDAHILGLNITVPYKQDVLNYLCYIDGAAQMIGAVNTLKYTNTGYAGYNTDAEGLSISLKESGINLKGKDVLILGAGGVARAVAYVCISQGCSSLSVLNRTYENAEKIANDFSGKAYDYSSTDSLDRHEYIAFQATNVGMYPNTDEHLPVPDSLYSKFSAGIDLIYNPKETDFIKTVSKHGGKVINGFSMLINQALASRKIWKPDEIIPADIRRKVFNECTDYSWS